MKAHLLLGLAASASVWATGCGRGSGDCTREGETEIVVERVSQIDGLSRCTILPGLLVHNNTELEEIDLPEAETMTGSLRISDNELIEAVRLPNLTNVDGELSIQSPRLHTIDLGSLEEVGTTSVSQTMSLSGTVAGGSVDIGPLYRAADLGLSGLHGLDSLDLSHLEINRDAAIVGNPDLADIAFGTDGAPDDVPASDSLGIVDNPVLDTLTLNVTGLDLRLTVAQNAVLPAIDAPNLVSVPNLVVDSNAMLDTVSMPSLTSGLLNVTVTDNPMLSFCEIQELIDQVADAGGEPVEYPTSKGNLEDKCP